MYASGDVSGSEPSPVYLISAPSAPVMWTVVEVRKECEPLSGEIDIAGASHSGSSSASRTTKSVGELRNPVRL